MAKIDKDSTNKDLLKNTGVIAIGQISTRIISFFLLPLYTSILSTTEYGLVDLLTTYSGMICVIIGLQMNQAVFRFLVTNRGDSEKIKRIISTIFFITYTIFLVYTSIFWGIQNFLEIECKWFLLLHVIVSVLLQIMSGIARGVGQNIDYAIGNFLASVIILGMNVILVAIFKMGIEAMLSSYVIGTTIGGLYIFVRCRIGQYISVKYIDKTKLKDILKYSLPLIPNELSWSVIHSSDKWIVSLFIGVAANGLIAVASKFSTIYTTVFSIFNTSWTEQVVLHYKDEGGKEYVKEMFESMIVFWASLTVVIIAVMPFAFKLLVNEQFVQAYKLIPIYMVAVFFNAVVGMLSTIYLVEKETKQIAVSTGVAAIINILVDILLINVLSVYAAPISSLCGYACIGIWRFKDINRRHCKLHIPERECMGILMILVIVMVGYYLDNMLLHVITFMGTCFITVMLNKDIIKSVVDIIKRSLL